MAIINCPQCGKEISDKAQACPHCGRQVGKSIVPEEKETVVPKKRSKKGLIIGISILIIALAGIVLFLLYRIGKDAVEESTPKSYNELSDERKIEVITQHLGSEIEVNGSISVTPELLAFYEDAELFGYYGTCQSGYPPEAEGPTVKINAADWISKEEYSDKMYHDIVSQLAGIYGDGETKTNEYTWKDKGEFSSISCKKNSDNKVDIKWSIDSDTKEAGGKKQKSKQEFKMYTEYEGKFNAGAGQHEADAEQCFLEELEERKKSAVEFGASVENTIWELSGTFEQSGNYYYFYTYSFVEGTVESHVLIMYDVDGEKTSVETPKEWLNADIEEAESRLDSN